MTSVLRLLTPASDARSLSPLAAPASGFSTLASPPHTHSRQWDKSEAPPQCFSPSRRIMQAVLDHTIPYLHMREAFGQKIGHFQVSGIVL